MVDISVTLNNGSVVSVQAGTSVAEFMKSSEVDAKTAFVAKMNGKLVDLATPLTEDATLECVTFDTSEGREVFWHSSAHVLGQALQNLYSCNLVNGPPVTEGFYYDVDTPHPISTVDFPAIEEEMMRIVKKNMKFKREKRTKEELLSLYSQNPFKQHFINKYVDYDSTLYYNDEFYDLCRGPHIPSTGFIGAVKLLKTSSAYFLNDSSQPSLQRVYAISFPTKQQMKEYVERAERAAEMDHRKVGREMDLFFFHKYSPGSCFWLPDGAHIYNKLIEFIRTEYRNRGFKEVITPNIFSVDLWKESGHYENYKENIYMLQSENFALKPMNCPGHCLMFRCTERSFRDLPLRFADFGVLHRDELSGALSGLTRVRRFQQDDAHIFCSRDQIKGEIAGCLDFLRKVYETFNFGYELRLSTRPEKYLGSLEQWDVAEAALRDAISDNNLAYVLNEGDGAFYGPKIDVVLCDAIGRKIQCATIQLDFQLPQRFNLKFTGSDGADHTPVIIHRAVFGSIERMIAIIIESFGKKLPFWLTPRQVALVPVYADEYATKLSAELVDFEVRVYDDPGSTLNKRIRSAQVDGYRLICVVGRKEEEKGEVSVRVGNRCMNVGFGAFKKILAHLVKNKTELNSVEDLEEKIKQLGMHSRVSSLSLE